LSTPTDNQIYGVPANQSSPSAGTTLLDDGHKTYKNTEIKLSVKVIYSGTKEGEGGVGGADTQQNWHPLPWTKTIEKQKIACLLSSLTWLYEEFCGPKKTTCQQNQAFFDW